MNEEVLANNLKKMLDTTTPPEPPKLVTNLVDCMTAVEVTGLMLYCSALIGQRATAELVCHMAKRKQIDLSVIRAFEDAGGPKHRLPPYQLHPRRRRERR